jgi:hypothetical protein
MAPLWPTGPRTVFFDDVASRTTLSKAVASGRIQRLAPKVFSADTAGSAEEIVLANWSKICGRLVPGAVIVDRSAATPSVVSDSTLTLAAGINRKRIKLPGLEIRIRPGSPMASDLPWTNGMFMSSPARTLVDNLETTRARAGNIARTLSRSEVEDWVAAKSIAWGPERTDRLRSQALDLAAATGREKLAAAIDRLFDQLAGREPPGPNPGALFLAVTQDAAWDQRRISMFATAFDTLSDLGGQGVPAWLPAADPPGELPFYESYFSNYIEGTEFSIEEARSIVETQTPPAERPADGHDILGTYRCVVDPVGRAATSADPDDLIVHLIARHREIMRGRPDKLPGRWKTSGNQVGVYQFVEPDLVEGTLRKGLERIGRLPVGLPRALYVMLVVTEVHPFVDGNGRVARVMMNAELSHADMARIVIPTVFRNEYLGGLRRVSVGDGDLAAFLKVMTYAWRWTAAMGWTDPEATSGQLAATNALYDSTDAATSGIRLELP